MTIFDSDTEDEIHRQKLELKRIEQLRIQALGAAISRRDWWACEQAYNAIRDAFDRPDIHARASQDAGQP